MSVRSSQLTIVSAWQNLLSTTPEEGKMSNGFGQSPKKQAAGQGTVFGGPTIQTSEGTVYNGPVVPPRGGAYNGAAAGTAYPGHGSISHLKTPAASAAHAQKSG